MTDPVLIERRDGIAIVTLNRPEAMNALSSAMRSHLNAAFLALALDRQIRVIVITGAGDRAFCAGLDLKELGQQQGAVFAAIGDDPTQNPAIAMDTCAKPIIGAVNGVAVTGGFEIALCCDMLIASSNARFADTHARVEVMPGWGLSQRLQRLIGSMRAKELSLSGRFIDAKTAYDWGLVNRVVAPEDLMAAAMELAAQIASASPEMIARYKSLIDRGGAMSLGDAMALEHAEAVRDHGTIDASGIEARRRAVLERNRSHQT